MTLMGKLFDLNKELYSPHTLFGVVASGKQTGFADLSNLKAYYKFNEASGDLLNLATSVGSSDSNSVDLGNTNVTQGATGLIGDAYDYDGTDDVSAESAASTAWEFMYNTSTGIFSFVGWVKQNVATQAGNTTILDNADFIQGTGITFLVSGTNNNRVLDFNLSKSDNSQDIFKMDAGDFPSDTNFNMCFVSWDASDGSVQMSVNDGTKDTFTSTITGISGTADQPMTFGGARSPPINEFNGLFDEFSFWNRVLTDAEVTSLFNSGAGLEL